MVVHASPLLQEVQRLYEVQGRDIDFSLVLSSASVRDDAALAELIEVDGRTRISRGTPVRLERYLEAVPDLRDRPDALDAAIDVTLRSLGEGHRSNDEAVGKLISQFPELKLAIREAAALNAAIWSTTGLRASVAPAPAKSLPCDFGPIMPEGMPRYQLQKLLGQGAFGQVYLALDRQLSEAGHTAWVAIKILVDRDRSPWARQRMIEEATKARRISHPNVVLVMDRGISADDQDFIVYEYVDGGDLSDLVQKGGPITTPDAVSMVAKIARGVHAAHSAGVIHCDLKPGNIMLTGHGQPKVADFGIAVRVEDSRQSVNSTAERSDSGGPIGNLAFVSPEQYRGEDRALSVQSDVFALGGILFLLLTRQLPNGSTLDEIARTHDAAHGRTSAPSVRPLAPTVDGDLEAICRRALSSSPHDRHSSAAAFADDLEAWLRREPIRWTRPSFLRVVTLWIRRKPTLAASVVAIALLTITGSVALVKMLVARELVSQRLRYETSARRAFSTLQSEEYRFNTELFPIIWMLEWFYGPTVIDSPDAQAELWQGRVQAIRRLVESAELQGSGDQLQPMLWKSTLAFWLVCGRQHQEAASILNQAVPRWKSILGEGDPWLNVLGALEHCADVDRLIEASQQSRPSDSELRSLEAKLQDDESVMGSLYRGSQIHLLVLQRMADLNEPALLNHAGRRDELAKSRAELLAEKPFKAKRQAAEASAQHK